MPAKKTTSKKTPAKKSGNVPAKQDAENEVMIPGIDMSADVGSGMEGADGDSFAIAILRILQSNSPQCDEAQGEFIEGARPGMLFNTATQELFNTKEEEVHFLPCAFQRRYIRWAPRGADGSGYKGEYMPEEINAMMKADQLVDHEGRTYFYNEDGKFLGEKKNDRCVDTRSHFGILITESGYMPVLFPLASTQVKKSKRLMSIMSAARIQSGGKSVTPPTWLNRIKVTTVPEQNDEGSWYGVKFEPDGFIDDPELYNAGKSFHDMVLSGGAKPNYDAEAGEEETDENF